MEPDPAAPPAAVDGPARAGAVAEARRLVQEEHLSANEASARVAAPLGVSGRSVARWAAQAGRSLGEVARDSAKTRAASELWAARGGYSALRRMTLCDKLLRAVEDQVEAVEAGELKDLAVAFGVLSDKRAQLEDRIDQRTALADPAYWAWLAAQCERDPVQHTLHPPPYAAAPEPVSAANFYQVAGAAPGLAGFRNGQVSETDKAPGVAVAGESRRRARRAPDSPERQLTAQLGLLRNGRASVAKRMAAAKAIAEEGWGPAPEPADLAP